MARGFAALLLSLALVADHADAAASDRPLVGLALGGGSAKGMSHVGVLRWLEEHRVPVDLIAGTSTGAFIGGAYATGMTASDLETLLRDLDWDLILRRDIPYPLKSLRRKEDDRDFSIKIDAGVRHGFRLQSGLNPGHFIGLLLSRVAFPYSSVPVFDDLVIPFRAAATDLQSGEIVVMDRGPLASALRASMALPGSFDPVRWNGRLLTDGGVLNNVPVDVVRGMGAGVVIAVSVDSPEPAPPEETIGGVANRAIALMMRSLDQPRLREADVVIVPDLQGLTSSDFRESATIIERGYQAAEARSAELLPHALSAEAWAEYQTTRQGRLHPRNGPVTFVEVEGVSDAAGQQIVDRVEEDLLHAHEPTAIESHLNWVVGMGRYASAMYCRVQRGSKEGLHIDVRDKSYAPPSVKFSIQLDNENKNLNLALGSRLTFFDVTTPGSEWRFDASLGSTLGLSTELLQPLRGVGPLRRGVFLAPRAQYVRTSDSLYSEGALTGVYSRQRVSAGLDVGWIAGRNAQFRLGYESAYVPNDARIGDRAPESRGSEQSLRIRLEHDRQDRAYFPTRGLRFSSQASWILDAPGVARSFVRAEAAIGVAGSFARKHAYTIHIEAGASSGSPPLLYQFPLGGPFRLGAFAPKSLRGPRFFLGRATYRWPLARLPALLGDRLYAMGLIEGGSVFERASEARVNSSVGGGLAADTFLGPFFVGASVGRGGAVRAYFILGGLVR